MKHFATSQFWFQYRRLPGNVRHLADKNFAMLKDNSSHSSLRFKKVQGGVWSVRVGLHYRALAVERLDGFYWFWIGHHGEYDVLLS